MPSFNAGADTCTSYTAEQNRRHRCKPFRIGQILKIIMGEVGQEYFSSDVSMDVLEAVGSSEPAHDVSGAAAAQLE
eukprot:scaffold465858_cov19-Prasinocladus_malaysianus.AAC.1